VEFLTSCFVYIHKHFRLFQQISKKLSKKENGFCDINDGFDCLGKLFKQKNITLPNVVDSSKKEIQKEPIIAPIFYDLWGYPVNWTNPQDGWDEQMRKSMVQLMSHTLIQSAEMPAYTDFGYEKRGIPDDLFKTILENQRINETLKWEDCIPSPHINCESIVNGAKINKNNVQLIQFNNERKVKRQLVKTLKPILEKWSRIKVSSKEVTIYGIRRYLRGSWLSLHVDKVPSHILSIILQVPHCGLYN
jgi:hypothetical protein